MKYEFKGIPGPYISAGRLVYKLYTPYTGHTLRNAFQAQVTRDLSASSTITDEETENTSALFAAAPELLEVLIEIVGSCTESSVAPGVWDASLPRSSQLNKAKAAIHKALNL